MLYIRKRSFVWSPFKHILGIKASLLDVWLTVMICLCDCVLCSTERAKSKDITDP